MGKPRRAPFVTWPNIGLDVRFTHLRLTLSEDSKNNSGDAILNKQARSISCFPANPRHWAPKKINFR